MTEKQSKIGGIIIYGIIIFAGCVGAAYFIGTKHGKKIAVDFNCNEPVVSEETKYKFLGDDVSNYICELSSELNLDPDLVVAILMVENPEFDNEVAHKNENGTIDVGLFQLNDKYLWSTFKKNYWFSNIELDPFNWKHNAYIALHHIQFLQQKMKVTDDVIMAYNCGEGAVMNRTIPDATYIYLAKVKNNIWLLKNQQ